MRNGERFYTNRSLQLAIRKMFDEDAMVYIPEQLFYADVLRNKTWAV